MINSDLKITTNSLSSSLKAWTAESLCLPMETYPIHRHPQWTHRLVDEANFRLRLRDTRRQTKSIFGASTLPTLKSMRNGNFSWLAYGVLVLKNRVPRTSSSFFFQERPKTRSRVISFLFHFLRLQEWSGLREEQEAASGDEWRNAGSCGSVRMSTHTAVDFLFRLRSQPAMRIKLC